MSNEYYIIKGYADSFCVQLLLLKYLFQKGKKLELKMSLQLPSTIWGYSFIC